MWHLVNQYNTIIVGAGQAGLAMGYYLKQKSKSFLLIDSHSRVGNSWRFRYDSLKLFTPKSHSALPGMLLPGNQNGFPTKDEVANYLEEYAQKFNLPMKLNNEITKVIKENNKFHIFTESGHEFISENLIVATGPFQIPYIPNFSTNIPSNIVQVHSAYYKNPSQLNDGTTLVVGGGNSGMQIAAELASTRDVYISLSKRPKFLPYEVLNKSIFWWFNVLGISKLTVESRIGKILKKNDPIIGKEINPLIKLGKVKILPRTISNENNKVLLENSYKIEPQNIIWATGYKDDYRWFDIPQVFDNQGRPIHNRGVTKEKGLYFIGLSWQYRRGSELLLGVGEDAKYLAKKL